MHVEIPAQQDHICFLGCVAELGQSGKEGVLPLLSALSRTTGIPQPQSPPYLPHEAQAHTLDELGQFPSLGHTVCEVDILLPAVLSVQLEWDP